MNYRLLPGGYVSHRGYPDDASTSIQSQLMTLYRRVFAEGTKIKAEEVKRCYPDADVLEEK